MVSLCANIASRWFKIFKNKYFTLLDLAFVVVAIILLESCWKCATPSEATGIIILGVVALIFAMAAAVDVIAWMFNKLDSFVDVSKWYDFESIKKVMDKPPVNEIEMAEAEVSLINNIPFELKGFVLQLGTKLSMNVLLFITCFAIIFTCINRISFEHQTFEEEIGTSASVAWSMFYSLDVITTLGGASPTPSEENTMIWIATGLEIVFLIVFSLIILSLATASVYEVFNLKTTYYSAFLHSQSKLEKSNNTQ